MSHRLYFQLNIVERGLAFVKRFIGTPKTKLIYILKPVCSYQRKQGFQAALADSNGGGAVASSFWLRYFFNRSVSGSGNRHLIPPPQGSRTGSRYD